MNKVWHKVAGKAPQNVTYKGVPFSSEVAPFLRHMALVEEHREALLRIQSVWDTLALLGQMSGAATDIAHTRTAFQELTATLLDSLARRLLASALERQRGKARVAIDILVRNLFERTADVGFLASDGPLCAHLALDAADPAQAASRVELEARFQAYVAKYSVYDDIVVLSREGQVLARLDRSVDTPAEDKIRESWVTEALNSDSPYIERYGATAILGGRQGLVYAKRIQTAQGASGVLCLSFRLADEMDSVFRQLQGSDDRSVICLLDADGCVLQSSDPWQIAPGARLRSTADRLVFAGREYLSVAASASGYEGYMGPQDWSVRVLTPLEWAFDIADEGGQDDSLRKLGEALDTGKLFDAELQDIPLRAQGIQRNLSRTLWNGKLRGLAQLAASEATDASASFSTTLLNEVQRTGEQLRLVFEQAIGNLQNSALAAVFDGALFQARLAIDIMDRNLYERANDCRWWALDAKLQRALAAQETPQAANAAADAAQVLRYINGLYTVYSLLLVFDTQGRVIAVSDPAQSQHVGQRLNGPWVEAALSLRDRERYVVSRHEATGLYPAAVDASERSTYVYSTAVQHEGRVVGGIAIVFDGEPQFAAMLRDALPESIAEDGTAPTAVSLFVTREGRIVSSSDERWPVGTQAPLLPTQLDLAAGETLRCELELDDMVYAVGVSMSKGYREYRFDQKPAAEDVAAVMMLPLGSRLNRANDNTAHSFTPLQPRADEDRLELACFSVGGQWLSLPAAEMLEALEQPRITNLPNAPRALVGMLQHAGRMLPALDLGLALFDRACDASDAPVIICRHPQTGKGLALRVDELGPVFSVTQSQIQPSPKRGGRERLVRGDPASQSALLTLLSLDELWEQIGQPMPMLAASSMELLGAE